MRKRLIIINSIVLCFSLIIMLVASWVFIINSNEKNAKTNIQDFLEIACRIYNGTNATETAELLYSRASNVRITIISYQGEVLADTMLDQIEDNHLERPEITSIGQIVTRYSSSMGIEMMYIAAIDHESYVRVAIPKYKIEDTYQKFIIFGSITLLLILICSILLINYFSKNTLKPLNKQINRFSTITGVEINSITSDEEKLALSIDRVYTLINQKISEIENEKNKVLLVINSIKQGFILIDQHKNIELINDEALKILNYQDIWQNRNYLYIIRNLDFQNNIENAYIDKNNRQFEIEENHNNYLIFINYYDGQIAIFIADITFENKMQKMKKEFFDHASHELKSPLTSIIGYQQLISQKIITDSDEIDYATNKTIKEANRMNKIIVEMLELSKLESQTELEDLENIIIKDIMYSCIDSKTNQINEKNITINCKMDNSIFAISYSDIYKLLSNLLSNAIKYNKPNGLINITISNQQIIIEDSGVGIRPEHIDRIFERFYRVDQAKSKEMGGTGLGLAIVKHICLRYGYQIKVESKYGEGSKFTITCK